MHRSIDIQLEHILKTKRVRAATESSVTARATFTTYYSVSVKLVEAVLVVLTLSVPVKVNV